MDSLPEVTEVQDRGPAAYIAEFIGTLLLVFFITAVVSLYVAAPIQTNPAPFIDFSVIGLVGAFLLFGLIQTLALVSGAHFNPAVTAAMRSWSDQAAGRGLYIVAQLAGGVGGALLTKRSSTDEGEGRTTGSPPSPRGSTRRSFPAWSSRRSAPSSWSG